MCCVCVSVFLKRILVLVCWVFSPNSKYFLVNRWDRKVTTVLLVHVVALN